MRAPRKRLFSKTRSAIAAATSAFRVRRIRRRFGRRDSAFVAEPVHNLVHRDLWSAAGSTFVASRAEAGREFLASSDSWFRPVNFYIGPDDALYVIDYYRKHIEHPEWTSSEHHHASLDFS